MTLELHIFEVLSKIDDLIHIYIFNYYNYLSTYMINFIKPNWRHSVAVTQQLIYIKMPIKEFQFLFLHRYKT